MERVGGPTHPYMLSSPACWASFGALQAAGLELIPTRPAAWMELRLAPHRARNREAPGGDSPAPMEFARFHYPPAHELAVDAYAASHPGGSERRARQSSNIHLLSLCACLERGESHYRRLLLLRRLTERKLEWPLLTRPQGSPQLNHTHAAGARELGEYTRRVEEWARAVWDFWAPEHPRVRRLLDEVGEM